MVVNEVCKCAVLVRSRPRPGTRPTDGGRPAGTAGSPADKSNTPNKEKLKKQKQMWIISCKQKYMSFETSFYPQKLE